MRSESEIRYNFNQARQKAEELDRVASDLKKLANSELEGSLQQLSIAWKGDAATLYLQKGEKLRDKIIKSAASLSNIANTIRDVSKRTYDAEMRALQIAREREYKRQLELTNGTRR